MAKLPNEKYFEYFQTICNIEHASYYPQKIIPALKKLILELGYQPKIDAQHNLFFKIPASRGYEKRPSVLLQAHTDMVFVSKKNSKNKNVKIQVNGDKLSANGTSLGADNGIGVSYILAIAADHKIRHPELEILLT
jgi:dipeptidase D